jgi:site-specific DNA-adenine methylase
MLQQFIINYYGTKFKESKELNNLDFSNYKTIIEPFGGSFGFSRYLYEIKGLKNLKYIIYDNDKELIDFYNYIKELILNNEIQLFIDEYNKHIEILNKEFSLFNITNLIKDKKILQKKPTLNYVNLIENKQMKFMLIKNIYNIISSANYKKNLSFLEMFKNTDFIYNNFNKNELLKYDKESTLIYLDPPYLLKFNNSYKDCSNMEFFFETIEYTLINYNSIFIHSYNFLIHKIFEKYEKLRYNKKYGFTRNQLIHVVYMNTI